MNISVEFLKTNENSLIITPLKEDNFNFSDLILEDLINEGYEGKDLLKELKKRSSNIRPAINKMIEEAKNNNVSTEDIFGDS